MASIACGWNFTLCVAFPEPELSLADALANHSSRSVNVNLNVKERRGRGGAVYAFGRGQEGQCGAAIAIDRTTPYVVKAFGRYPGDHERKLVSKR